MKRSIFAFLSIFIVLSALLHAEVPTRESVTKLYVATFNRAPDSAGLNYWLNDSGLQLEQIAQSFFDQPETQTLYPPGTHDRNFIQSVYGNLFNRNPESAGWNYWEQELSSGRIPKSVFILAVINGALGTDAIILKHKKEVGFYFALYGYNDTDFARSIMLSITEESDTVDAAKELLYARSGTSSEDACIVDYLYYDGSTYTACYVDLPKEVCSGVKEYDNEANWYGFPVKGECIALGYPKESQILSDSGYVYYWMSGLFSESSSLGTGDSYVQIITPDNLVAEYGGVKIAFSPYDIDGEKTLTIQQVNPKLFFIDGEINNYQVKAYNFTLSGKTEFGGLIEITLPYDESFIKGEESGSVMAMYYNPSSNKYEPIDYEIDTQKNEVKILTDHLSEYAIFVLANGTRHGAFKVIKANTRNAYITATDAYYKFISSSIASNIINGAISNNMVEDIQAYEAGYSAANEWLGLMAAGNGLASAPFSSTFLTSLGNSFNHIGFGASVLQASIDFGKGDNVALFSNLSKNIVYNIVNYAGSSALQLSFVGVFAIDYSLNKFGTEALNGLEEKWKKIYDACYNDGLYKTDPQWYHAFKALTETSISPSRLKNVMETTVYNNAYSAWSDDMSKMALCAGVNESMGFNALGTPKDSIKENIARDKFYELIERLQPVFDQLRKKTIYNMRSDYKKQLEDVRNNLNQKINVQIKETVASGETAKYAGYRFRFAPLNDKAIKSEWTNVLDSKGSATGAWRILGYMQAGSPNKLEIYKPGDDPDTDKPVRTIDFKITPPNLVINIGEGGTCGDDGCDFSKLNTIKIAFGINQTDFMYGPYSFTNPVTGETLTNQYDHRTGTYSAPDPWEDANFLTCSIAQYNSGVFSSSCYSSEGKYNLSIVFALDSETQPTMFKTVKIHMTDEDGSSVYSNYKNIPLDLSGMQISDDGFVTILKDSIHGNVGSGTFCGYFQDLSGFYYLNYGDGTINKYELQSYDCGKGGKIFIEMSVK